jgi:DNA gyrase subunit B
LADNREYNDDSIKSLGYIEGVRFRPSTFVESIGPRGILKLLLETIQNSVDEHYAGICNEVSVIIDTKNVVITVIDNGRGIPVNSIDKIMSEIFSGGKYDEKNYAIHSGSNGLGLSILQILSDWTDLEIYRDNKICNARYEKGYKKYINIKDDPNQTKTGTKVSFRPSMDIFFSSASGYSLDDEIFNSKSLINIIEPLAYIHAGLKINLNIDGEKHKFYFVGSFDQFLNVLMKRDHLTSMIKEPFISDIRNEHGKHLEVILCFCREANSEHYYSYINGFPTIEHGRHVDAVRASISKALTMYIKSHDYIPKTAKFNVTGADIVENVVAIVKGELPNALFINQTKNKLTSEDFYVFAAPLLYNEFNRWIASHPEDIDKICKLAVLKAKANYAAKEARQIAMEPSTTKNILQSKIDLKKFTDCSGNNPEENELFLLEGDSAGGSVNQARDSRTQAFLRLRGKLLNVLTKKGQLSAEQEAIVTILGMGFGEKKNIKKLKYHKIIIMADADADGGHIASLCIAFFYVYYPELIEEGYLYVAMPPYYRLTYKNKRKLYILNKEIYRRLKKLAALKVFDLVDAVNKPISKKIFEIYVDKLVGYKEFIDNYSIELNIDPVLLELIVRQLDNLIKGKYKQFSKYDYITTEKSRTKTSVIFEFDKDYGHTFVNIDKKFYKEVYAPIYTKLCDIYLGNVKLKVKNTDTIYSGTSYELSSVIESILVNKHIDMTSYKGIGEVQPAELWDTSMNPKTRQITRITMENAKNAEYWLQTLLGNTNIKDKKDLFLKL